MRPFSHRIFRSLGQIVPALLFAASLGLRGADPTVARIWDETLLDAIRIDKPHPPVHARNLFSLSVVMYDAWAAYDPVARGYVYTNKHTALDSAAARRAAISQAAYRLLKSRFVNSVRAADTSAALDARMTGLGYDTNSVSEDPSTPAGLGNLIFHRVNDFFLTDGSRQQQAYADYPPSEGGYQTVNLPLLIGVPGTRASDVSHWQVLAVTDATTQNGIPTDSIQKFLGAHWRDVRPFALARSTVNGPWIDPGPPPQLGGDSLEAFRSNVVAVIRASSELTTEDGVQMDISPGAFGNASLGESRGTGHPLNPVTGLPYAPNMVKRGDFTRVLAEYWADGPHSETPPGHWNVIANRMRDHPDFHARLGGVGPELDPLEWDVKMYFALNAAVHDAACAAWTLKREYDGWRPMSAIRFMALVGQSSDPTDESSYSILGLPLVPGLIELTTAETLAPGGRHEGLYAPVFDEDPRRSRIGRVAIRTWRKPPLNPTNEVAGVGWIRGDDWWTYQARNFVTPAFPGYVSGHSTFSRAAAEVLAAMTGSPFFPGGLSTATFEANHFLRTEMGPSETITLQWATYFDAADQAGLSRIWGGIHAPCDDVPGRVAGAQAGRGAWAKALSYFGALSQEVVPARTALRRDGQQLVFTVDAIPGSFYRLQKASTLEDGFTSVVQEAVAGPGSTLTLTQPLNGSAGYFRVVRTTTP